MPEIKRTIELPATVDTLWEKLSDISKFDEWMTIHTSFKGVVPPAHHQGRRHLHRGRHADGMANTIEWTVREADSSESVLASKKGTFRVTGTGMAGVQATIQVSVDGTGGDVTVVDLDSKFEGQMLVGAMGKAIDKAVGLELDISLAKLAAAI